MKGVSMNRNKVLRDWERFMKEHRIGIIDPNVLFPAIENAIRCSDDSMKAGIVELLPEAQSIIDHLESGAPRLTWNELRTLSDEELVARQDRTGDMAGLFNPSQYEVPLMDEILKLMDGRPNFFLDIGCGAGHRSNFIAAKRLALKCLGIDLSELAVAKALRFAEHFRSGVEFMKASCTQLPLDDGHVDFVLMADVLPWVMEWQKAIAEIGRVLKPDGKLLLVYNFMPDSRMQIPPADAITALNQAGITSERFDMPTLNAVFIRGRRRWNN